MKRLNPLYIISLFITIFFISVFLLQQEKDNFKQKSYELIDYKIKSKEYKNLKDNWTNEKFVNDSLDQILKNKIFLNQKISRISTNELVKLKIESDDYKVLDYFLNKILNKQFVIKRIEIEKKSINLEIGIK
jgi:hypothetical protein